MAYDRTGKHGPRHFMSIGDEARIDEILAKVGEKDAHDLTDVDRLTLAVDKLPRVLEAKNDE
jgi:hypothetical protein